MKTVIYALILGAAIPFAACTTVNTTDTTHRNLDGSVTHEQTTVQEHPNGSTTVDQTKTTSR